MKTCRIVWASSFVIAAVVSFGSPGARADGTRADGAGAELATSSHTLITQTPDERNRVTLVGNTHPLPAAAEDLGALAVNLPLEHMHLQLQRAPADEQAVADFVSSLQDRGSSNYHHWLTSAQFGERFGLATADIDRITAWLTAHGLTVNFVYPNRMVIDFSGTAGQVAAAFHTEIHRVVADGAAHITNVRDPQIPAALAPAVAGIVSLHDFRGRNRHVSKPRYTAGGGNYWIAPADLAVIYHFNPLFDAGIIGKGERIATIEDTNLYADADWSNFRRIFDLAKYTSGKLVVEHPAAAGKAACANPGVSSNGDDVEAALDVEWASAAAPGATIVLASCDSTQTTDGLYIAIQNLVNSSNPPPIISISYGVCETQDGAAENRAFKSVYQQAVAESISVFVATGDAGAVDCQYPGDNGATVGIGVNGWASTAYNVAVGGTDFSDVYSGTTANYWKTSNTANGSAKSYVPETPWNDTCASSLLARYNTGSALTYGSSGFCNNARKYGTSYRSLGGGEGGPSGCATGAPATPSVVGGTCKGTPKPGWQSGLVGMPTDGVRDIPDIALFASDGTAWSHQYMLCFTDTSNDGTANCNGDPSSWAAGGGGTSYSTPIAAGLQALINQHAGGPQGNPAPIYYQLAKAEYGAAGDANCNASKGAEIAGGCVFVDVTLGNDTADCTGIHDCYRPSGAFGVLATTDRAYEQAYSAKVGYDFPTGIGSPNAYNLVEKWPK